MKFAEHNGGRHPEDKRPSAGPTPPELIFSIKMREQLSDMHDGIEDSWWMESQESMWEVHEYMEDVVRDAIDQERMRTSDLHLYKQETSEELAERLYREDWESGHYFDYEPEWEYGGRVYPGAEPRDLKIRRLQIGSDAAEAYNSFF